MYPQNLFRKPGPDSVVVNNDAERAAAAKDGYTNEPPAVVEFPKLVYLHPVDKTKEHSYVAVNNQEEQDKAADKGYKLEPHVPQVPTDESFEGTKTTHESLVAGSGSERYNDTGYAGPKDEYGIKEYTDQSAYPTNPIHGTIVAGAVPTQAQTDAVVARANAEEAQRRDEAF